MKLGLRLFVAFLAMAVLIVGFLWFVQAFLMRDVYLLQRTSSVAASLERAVSAERINLAELAEQTNASLLILRPDGSLAERSPGMARFGLVVRQALELIPERADGRLIVLDADGAGHRFGLIGRRLNDGRYLFASFSLSDADAAAQILRRQLGIVSLILLAASFLFAVILSRHLSRPILEVAAKARAMSRGDLAVSFPPRGDDEIGELQRSLSFLGGELGKTEQLRRELIANVSHELRSPLAIIRGYAELVRDVTWPDEERRTAQLNVIAGEAERLTRVVQDILDYSRLQSGVDEPHLERVALSRIAATCRERFSKSAQEADLTVRLEVASITGEGWVNADPDRLDRVVHNLLQNAIAHADHGSTVVLTIGPDDHGWLRLSVVNRGMTIPPEDLPRIWQRFEQSRVSADEQRRSGSGLGLAIVKGILDQHRAAYGVTSEGGRTEFWFALPEAG